MQYSSACINISLQLLSIFSELVRLWCSMDLHMYIQVEGHTVMLTLVLAMDQFSWMMSSVPQVLASC